MRRKKREKVRAIKALTFFIIIRTATATTVTTVTVTPYPI